MTVSDKAILLVGVTRADQRATTRPTERRRPPPGEGRRSLTSAPSATDEGVVAQGVTPEQWKSTANPLETEADALWREYLALADEIDGLRWWNRWRRESELRSRLRKNRLQRDALAHRLTELGMLGEQKAV